jgi:hypothetical protein
MKEIMESVNADVRGVHKRIQRKIEKDFSADDPPC